MMCFTLYAMCALVQTTLGREAPGGERASVNPNTGNQMQQDSDSQVYGTLKGAGRTKYPNRNRSQVLAKRS